MKVTKYFSVFVLVLLSALLTTFSLAYWAGEIRGAEALVDGEANAIVIGEASSVKTSINVNSLSNMEGIKLVPKGRVVSENEKDSVEFKFHVVWEDKAQATDGEEVFGILNLESRLLGLDSELTDLFHLSIMGDQDEIKLNDPKGTDVTVMVDFVKEPSTKALYEKIINEVLKLELELVVETVS